MKIKLAKEAAGIIVPRVKLGGSGRSSLMVDLILDTGAAYTMISWDTALALGKNPAKTSRTIPIVTANGIIHAPIITLHSISIQDVTARNVPVICHNIPEMIEVSGLLGLTFLKNFRTTVDYRLGALSIE